MRDLGQKIKNRTLHPLFSQDMFEDKETSRLLNSDDLVCFIMGGTQFQILKSKFAYWPKTRLSMLIRAKTKDEILKLCDNVIFCDNSGQPKTYIFLRSGINFNSILDTLNFCIKLFYLMYRDRISYFNKNRLSVQQKYLKKYMNTSFH